ncbi:hypothetical protein [Actinomadura fibrosa]|uniref:DUF4190 domain-containing protein n=1 Tax=Actinomadura fibrosa TaxID=111802 RepID=A0ABW2XCM8_9ACTN|nr:hypothetical protein [Actinomadura fibrosa]
MGLSVCLLGMVPAFAGLVVGLVSVTRDRSERGLAAAGMVCSAVALFAGSLALVWLLGKAAHCGDEDRYPSATARKGCVEREFPFAQATTTP